MRIVGCTKLITFRSFNDIEGGSATECRLCKEGVGIGPRGEDPEATKTNFVVEVGIGKKGSEALFNKDLEGQCLTVTTELYSDAWEHKEGMNKDSESVPAGNLEGFIADTDAI